MKFLPRLVLPIVLSVFGLVWLTSEFGTARRGQFVFVRHGHEQIISSSNDPVTFWWTTGVLLGLGALLLATGIYLVFRSISRGLHSSPSEPSLPMPVGLRLLTTLCFALALFLPFSILPLDIYIVDDKQASLGEFWRSGKGPFMFLAGIIFPIIGYGFVEARTWAPYLFSGLWFLFLIKVLIFFRSIDDVLGTFVIAAAVTFYLFWWPRVREYFGSVTKRHHAP